MNELVSQLRCALLATLALALACCGAYPLVVFGLGQVCFADKANGSLVRDANGLVRGSKLLGQGFTAGKYFHPRPSAAGDGYDGMRSGGSNLGPTSEKLRDSIRDRVLAYRKENGLEPEQPVPGDAVTASGSGLDPHISVPNAELQVPRVARARGIGEGEVRALMKQHIDGPDLGMFGEPGVNVLTLNRALDSLGAGGGGAER
jgi:potassium-transporting ATPase KdpC subunit